MIEEAGQQEAAAVKIQTLKRGNTARAETAHRLNRVWPAVEAGDVKLLSECLGEAKVNLGACNADGVTPLRAALEQGKHECAALLIQHDASLAMPDDDALAVWTKVQASITRGGVVVEVIQLSLHNIRRIARQRPTRKRRSPSMSQTRSTRRQAATWDDARHLLDPPHLVALGAGR